jgi:hydrogenase maturation protease
VIGVGESGFGIGEETAHAHSREDAVLVLCLGNDILRDDGVGWAIADELETGLSVPRTPNPQSPIPSAESPLPNPYAPRVVVKRSALSGFYLLDELTGWDVVVVVDAVRTGAHAPGTVLSFPFEALRTEAGPSPHAVGLPTVVALGRQSGVPLPDAIHIVAIEVDDMESFCEGLTPAVRDAVPKAVDVIRSLMVRASAPVGAAV